MSLNKDRHSISTGERAGVYIETFESRGLRLGSLRPVVGQRLYHRSQRH
jgi:hypothetical protein